MLASVRSHFICFLSKLFITGCILLNTIKQEIPKTSKRKPIAFLLALRMFVFRAAHIIFMNVGRSKQTSTFCSFPHLGGLLLKNLLLLVSKACLSNASFLYFDSHLPNYLQSQLTTLNNNNDEWLQKHSIARQQVEKGQRLVFVCRHSNRTKHCIQQQRGFEASSGWNSLLKQCHIFKENHRWSAQHWVLQQLSHMLVIFSGQDGSLVFWSL